MVVLKLFLKLSLSLSGINQSLCGLGSSVCFADQKVIVKPIVIGTWGFKTAGDAALKVLQQSGSALDAIQGIAYLLSRPYLFL